MDDSALVQRAADGDMDAFGAIYDRYAGRLHDYFWWVLRDAELANDALYETLLEAGSRIGDLRDPARLRPWLFAIAGQESTHYRAPKPGETAPVAPPTGDAAWDGLVTLLGGVIDGMSPRDRILLDLRYRQGLDGQELGDALGMKPDDAAMLVGSRAQKVERDIGATAVAYFGRERCPALEALVGPIDEGLDAKARERVANHADMCQICAELRRRRIGPPALIALSPAPPLSPVLRDRVLEDVELADHAGRAWPARRLGFPPPLIGSHGRRWRFVAAAALIVLLGTSAYMLNRNGRATDVASVGTTVAPASSTTLRPGNTSTSTSSTSSSVPADAAGTGAGDTGSTGAPTGGTVSGGSTGRATGTGGGGGGGGGVVEGGGTGGGGGGGGDGGTTTPPTDDGGSDTTAPTTPPTTVPDDAAGPSLSGLAVSPSTVACGASATVTVRASDPSGVRSVTLYVVGLVTVQKAMASQGGGNYSASTGALTSPLSGPADLQVFVIATDELDNISQSGSTTLTLDC